MRELNGIYTQAEIKSRLEPVFSEYGVKRAVLFGSYANGTADEKSDVDLLVDSGLRGLKFCGLLDRVVTILEKETDLIDITHIEKNSRIDKEIAMTGVTIYEG